jgi:hypothetical protein
MEIITLLFGVCKSRPLAAVGAARICRRNAGLSGKLAA